MHFPGQLRGYQLCVLGGLLYAMDASPGALFTVMFPRQAGKNEVSAALVSLLLVTHCHRGGSIVVCAPTLHPQASISFERTVARIRRIASATGAPLTVSGSAIRCGNASATFLSGSPLANVAGHTASLLLIGDEAQDLDEEWFDRQFRPMTASTGASTVLFGTPWEGDSLLERAAARNRAHDAALPAASPLRRHHEVTWQEVAAANPAYGRYVEEERQRLGVSHPVFRSQYELASGQPSRRLLSPEQIAAIAGGCEVAEAPGHGCRYVAGLDFGGESATSDATVLTIALRDGPHTAVAAVYHWQGRPFEAVRDDVTALARRWGFTRLVCDATGMGAPLTAQLEVALGRVVEPFVFTAASKSALGFELAAAAATGALRIPEGGSAGITRLWHELRTCRTERRPGGQLTWEAPPGGHDDCVASLALAVHAANLLGAPRVARGRNRFDAASRPATW